MPGRLADGLMSRPEQLSPTPSSRSHISYDVRPFRSSHAWTHFDVPPDRL